MLGNGIPMHKLDGLRPLLERSGVALSDASHLSCLIPRIQEREHKLLMQELDDQFITFVFDGTTRQGEAVNVVYRYCPADFKQIEQRLVDFTTMEKHMNGNQLGRRLVEVLTNKAKIPCTNVVGSARDSCATNGAALRVIAPLFPAMLNVLCYSHMLQGTGTRFLLESMDEFVTPFLVLQSMPICKSLWSEIVGTNMKGYSKIRWWSRWELMRDLAKAFGACLDRFVHELLARDIGEESSRRMQAVLTNPAKRSAFELELAVVLDMERFQTTTYTLEGDGLCILLAYDMVEDLRKFGRSLSVQTSLPNTAALLRSRAELVDGVKFCQYWSEVDAPGKSGWYEGQIIGKKPGHGHLCCVRYSNGEEMWIKKSEEHAFRGSILAHELPEWKEVVAKVQPPFDYIDNRLTDKCDSPYHMELQHSQMRLIQVCACTAIAFTYAPVMDGPLMPVRTLHRRLIQA